MDIQYKTYDSEQYNKLKLGVTICLSQVALPIDQLRVRGQGWRSTGTYQNCKKLAAMSSLSVSLCFTTSVLDFCRRRPPEGLVVAAWLKLALRFAESEGLVERVWADGGLRPLDCERLWERACMVSYRNGRVYAQ